MKRYFKDIFQSIWTVLQGMKITGNHLFTRSCTLQYPSVKWELPERSRMRLFNKIEDCIGCGQCVRACPVDCIYMTTEKRAKEEPPPLCCRRDPHQASGHPVRYRHVPLLLLQPLHLSLSDPLPGHDSRVRVCGAVQAGFSLPVCQGGTAGSSQAGSDPAARGGRVRVHR